MHINATDRMQVVRLGSTLIVAIAAILTAPQSTRAGESCPPFWSVKDLAGRGWHAMAYDSRRDVTVMFGGSSGRRETREWNGQDWVLVSTDGPPPRLAPAMVYDEARGVTVLFGGFMSRLGLPTKYLADTWEWDGATWTHRDKDGPEPRAYHAMAYDSSRGVVVLFGGSTRERTFGDTWEWNGRRWTRVADTGPSARSSHALTYDRARNRIVLFGGYGRTERSYLADTWEWDGASWQDVSESGPEARVGHTLVYDHERGVSVMFGGHASEKGQQWYFFSDTWEWNGNEWTAIGAQGPSDRTLSAMVYDMQERVCLLFGGFNSSGPRRNLGDTWTFDGAEWDLIRPDSSPQRRGGHRMVFDSWRGACVMVGGAQSAWDQFSEVWMWDGLRWEERSSRLGRAFHGLAFDSWRGVVVLNGGMSGDQVMSDTWEWDGTRWDRILPTGPGGMEHVMTFDSRRGVTVMLDGSGRTHEYDGQAWTGRTGGPGRRSYAAMAFDSRRGVSVLFGGQGAAPPRGTWEWDGNAWALRSDTGPEARFLHAMAYDEARGVTVLLGGLRGSYDYLSDTWEWDGTSWTRGPDLPWVRADHAAAYDSDRGVIVMFGGFNDDETWELGGVPGDCDCDRQVDLGDFVALADCMLGPDESVPPECACSDATRDGDVDLEDFVRMQVPFGAPPPP